MNPNPWNFSVSDSDPTAESEVCQFSLKPSEFDTFGIYTFRPVDWYQNQGHSHKIQIVGWSKISRFTRPNYVVIRPAGEATRYLNSG